MRIISPFKDYYDGVQAQGHDQTLVYRRIPEVYELPRSGGAAEKLAVERLALAQAPDFPTARSRYEKDLWRRVILGVAGKLYQVAREEVVTRGEGMALPKYNFRYHYERASLIKAFPDQGWTTRYEGGSPKQVFDVERYPELGLYAEDDEPFLLLKAPVFVLDGPASQRRWYGHVGESYHQDGDQFKVNPSLKGYEFYRAVSDYEAFQDLAYFLGNVLVDRGPEPQPVRDLDKVRSHGFDEKMGFRKRKK